MKWVPLVLAIVALTVCGVVYTQLNNPPRGWAEEAGRKLAEMQQARGQEDRLRVEAAEQIDQMLAWKRTRLRALFPFLGLALAMLALQPALARALRSGLVTRGLLAIALALLVTAPVVYGRTLETPPGWAVNAAKHINEVNAVEANYDLQKVRTLRDEERERDSAREDAKAGQRDISIVLILGAVLIYAVFFFLTRKRSAAAAPPTTSSAAA